MRKKIFIYMFPLFLLFSQGCLTEGNMAPVGVAPTQNLTQEELFGYSSNTTSTKPQEEELVRTILLVGIVLLLLLILILRFQHTFLEEYNKPDKKI